jgi:pimeloyl-ACP methyl ester carboxylesterase
MTITATLPVTALGATSPATAPRYLPRPGGRIAYDDAGTGPLIVMLPGMGDLRQQYRFLAPALAARGFRTVTVDLRGHGASSTGWNDYGSVAHGEDLVALVEALGAGPALVIGTSFGAAPAVWAAAERPDLIRGLVLVGPFVRPGTTPPALAALMRVLLGGPWGVRFWGWWYGQLYRSRRPDDFAAYRAALVANLRESGRFDAVRRLMARDDREVHARLGRVAAPTLVVMGSRDPDFPDPQAEATAVATALRGDVHMVPGAGHYPHVERPEATAPAVLAFAEGVFGGR